MDIPAESDAIGGAVLDPRLTAFSRSLGGYPQIAARLINGNEKFNESEITL